MRSLLVRNHHRVAARKRKVGSTRRSNSLLRTAQEVQLKKLAKRAKKRMKRVGKVSQLKIMVLEFYYHYA